eukprot:TRINITY_DN1715_c0_g1_i1.p1 TRINITY_DN1715_c0_g1~~TRINITY_DN1715_c0_g1_i1.p1  ORF type:complete len:362 (+),score=110.54 TRINITY_DN1715_c0_g1_i1:497-1582(+)
MHHEQNPSAFPWQWTWKDASTKVQNMRHQYVGVKQKIRKVVNGDTEEYDWEEGLNLWSNFLKYKEVFGDVEINDVKGLAFLKGRPRDSVTGGGFAMGLDGGNGALSLGLGFDCDEGDENGVPKERFCNGVDIEFEDEEKIGQCSSRRKRKIGSDFEVRILGFLANQLAQLREREAELEDSIAERERKRERREALFAEEERAREERNRIQVKEREEYDRVLFEARKEEMRNWERKEEEFEARLQKIRDEAVKREREWEEAMAERRMAWRKTMEDMIRQHQSTMAQMQAQIVQNQQTMISQLIGIMLQFAGHPADLADHSVGSNPCVNQILQSLQHSANVNGIVSGGFRGSGASADNQFIVDE